MYTPHNDSSSSLFDGRLSFPDDEASNSLWGYRVDSVQDAIALPVLAPGSAVSHTISMDINLSHYMYGHASELLLRKTANFLGVELQREMKPCTGSSMSKGYRNKILRSTKTKLGKKLRRVFVDLSGPKSIPSLAGKRYVMVVTDDFSRYTRLYIFDRKSGAASMFGRFLADARADGVPSEETCTV